MPSVLLTYVFPGIGCVLSLFMFSSSLAAVLKVRKTKHLGELNPLPFAGILGQTSGQVIYGSVIKNWFIFWGNAPGLAIGLWLTLSTIVHARPRVQDLMTVCVISIAVYYSTIAVVTSHLRVDQETKNTVWGSAGAVALVCYYTSPLSTIVKVLRTKDSSSLHPPQCIMNFVNMCLWLSYGVAIHNPFIWIPEILGGVLSTSALLLLVVFPREENARLNRASEETEQREREMNSITPQAL